MVMRPLAHRNKKSSSSTLSFKMENWGKVVGVAQNSTLGIEGVKEKHWDLRIQVSGQNLNCHIYISSNSKSSPSLFHRQRSQTFSLDNMLQICYRIFCSLFINALKKIQTKIQYPESESNNALTVTFNLKSFSRVLLLSAVNAFMPKGTLNEYKSNIFRENSFKCGVIVLLKELLMCEKFILIKLINTYGLVFNDKANQLKTKVNGQTTGQCPVEVSRTWSVITKRLSSEFVCFSAK